MSWHVADISGGLMKKYKLTSWQTGGTSTSDFNSFYIERQMCYNLSPPPPILFQGCPGSPASPRRLPCAWATVRCCRATSTPTWHPSRAGRRTGSPWSWARGWSGCPAAPCWSATPRRATPASTAAWWRTWARPRPARRLNCSSRQVSAAPEGSTNSQSVSISPSSYQITRGIMEAIRGDTLGAGILLCPFLLLLFCIFAFILLCFVFFNDHSASIDILHGSTFAIYTSCTHL